MNGRQKGILYSILASVMIGLGYIPASKNLGIGDTVVVNLVWFLIQAIIFGLILLFLKRNHRASVELINNWRGILLVGLTSAAGALLWFWEIGKVGAVNTVFILQFTNVFAVLLGVIVLKERFNRRELLGGIVAMVGAFVFFWHNPDLSVVMVLILLFNSAIFATSNLLAKISVKDMDPIILAAGRVITISALIFLVSLGGGNWPIGYPLDFWLYSLFGAILSVAGFIFFYRSFSLIEVSKAQLARTPEPIFTMIFSFLLLGNDPALNQLIGGVMIIAGIAFLTKSRTK